MVIIIGLQAFQLFYFNKLMNEIIDSDPNDVVNELDIPRNFSNFDFGSGFNFDASSESFLLYSVEKFPESLKTRSRFSLDFLTTHHEGLIFIIYDNERQKDFISLFIRNHKLVYSFDCGSGPAYLETNFKVTEGKWHHVEFSRKGRSGKLFVDSKEVTVPDRKSVSRGKNTEIDVKPFLYLGGLDEGGRNDRTLGAKLNISVGNGIPGFDGCLRNVKYEHEEDPSTEMRVLGLDSLTKNNFVVPCAMFETGVFFGLKGGSVIVDRKFYVGLDFSISMMIKPKNQMGILAFVEGKEDYLLLELVNSEIRFEVNNGQGPISSIVAHDDLNLNDGHWHGVTAVKAKNVVTLSVDGSFAQPGIGIPGF